MQMQSITYLLYAYKLIIEKPMPADRPYTKTTVEAVRLLGQLIKLARKRRRMSETELSERANISRSTVRKIEIGDPSINIGLAFEAASVVGVPLFSAEGSTSLKMQNQIVSDKLALLSHKPSKNDTELKDNF